MNERKNKIRRIIAAAGLLFATGCTIPAPRAVASADSDVSGKVTQNAAIRTELITLINAVTGQDITNENANKIQ